MNRNRPDGSTPKSGKPAADFPVQALAFPFGIAGAVDLPDESESAVDGDEASPEEAIVEHSGGFFWQSSNGRQEFGPFNSRDLARLDRDHLSEETVNSTENLADVERDLEIGESIDPDSGEHVNGSMVPHLFEEE